MLLSEIELEVSTPTSSSDLLCELTKLVNSKLPEGFLPIRFAVVDSTQGTWRCEVGGISGCDEIEKDLSNDVFHFAHRKIERSQDFNAVFIVPTGIGAEIGGHAGDACPAVSMLSVACDRLITHPNVVNASDINELPSNGLYVEGSVLCRLLMGTLGLQETRSNRVLVVVGPHEIANFVDAVVNSVSAARAAYGMTNAKVIRLDKPLTSLARYTNSGRAAGRVDGCEYLLAVLEEHRGTYDSVAITSLVDVPQDFHQEYFKSGGTMVNPWGGVEALLTHAVSYLKNVPSAHAPMLENEDIAYMKIGRVEPRLAAEAVSMTFLNCVLKGLQRSPRIISDPDVMTMPGILTASDVSCLVLPDSCLGLPTLAALEQGIPVIAVRENTNLMKNDLSVLPWSVGQFFQVENYWEAAGVMLALKAGIDPHSVRRPLSPTEVEEQVSADKALIAQNKTAPGYVGLSLNSVVKLPRQNR